MKLRAPLLAIIFFFMTIPLDAADPLLAPTPPMGWNSWDSYGQTVNEGEIRANAEWMAKHLKRFGWQYVVIDEGWYILNPGVAKPADFHFAITDDGRFIPDSLRDSDRTRRCSAGFKPLADYIHSLGLKFGIHIIRGIPRRGSRQEPSYCRLVVPRGRCSRSDRRLSLECLQLWR